MSCTEAGYAASLPERKSSEIETIPCAAMAWWRSFSVCRSCRHQAPPWHSTSAGNGPSPRGLNTRAKSGLSPWRRYSTSSTSKSCDLASRIAVVIASYLFTSLRWPILAHSGGNGNHVSMATGSKLERIPVNFIQPLHTHVVTPGLDPIGAKIRARRPLLPLPACGERVGVRGTLQELRPRTVAPPRGARRRGPHPLLPP